MLPNPARIFSKNESERPFLVNDTWKNLSQQTCTNGKLKETLKLWEYCILI